MRLFFELVKISFQRQITYRAATLAGLTTNFFFGLLRASILIALYGNRREVAGISLEGVITYTGLTQAIIGFLSLFSWYEVMDSVYSGDIASDLLKPMNYYAFWLARDVGRAIVGLLTRGLTMMAAYAVFFGITIPHNAGQWLAVGLALSSTVPSPPAPSDAGSHRPPPLGEYSGLISRQLSASASIRR